MDDAGFFDYAGEAREHAPQSPGFLAAADDSDWAVILEHAQTRRYAAGARVAGPGQTDRALYVVLEGQLAAVPGASATYGPGSIFGERGFLEGRPSVVAIQARTDALVLRLGLTEFEVLAAKDPALGRYLLFDLARTLAARSERAL